MNRKMPPPVALRAFESAARHLSFTRAADELNVTQAAISHQIKALEEFFSCALFIRLTRKLRLTNEGQTLYSAANEAFGIIEDSVDKIRSGGSDEVLSISVSPYFSSKWLTPRLSSFWEKNPNIDLRLHHTSQQVLRPQDDIDLSITWGLDNWPSLDSIQFLNAKVIPVCSPKIITKKKPLKSINDLYHHTLLHETDYGLWTQWLTRMGVDKVKLNRGITMDDANIVMQAAIGGQGVALSSDILCVDDIAAGKLVMPYDIEKSMNYAYYLVYKPRALERAKVNAFFQWLMEQREREAPQTG